MQRLSASGGVEPRTFTGTVRMRGCVVWRCRHSHADSNEARACGAAQAELMSECLDVRCLCCGERVITFMDHFSPGVGDYTCRDRKNAARRSHRRTT